MTSGWTLPCTDWNCSETGQDVGRGGDGGVGVGKHGGDGGGRVKVGVVVCPG